MLPRVKGGKEARAHQVDMDDFAFLFSSWTYPPYLRSTLAGSIKMRTPCFIRCPSEARERARARATERERV
jgi:hypothetical protein